MDDAKRLAEAFEKVVAAYPAMSARIITGDDGVPSWVDASASSPLQIETVEMTDEQLRAGADSLVTPFDLEGGVLAHVKIITTEKGVYLFTDFHHTLFDATSHKAMLRALDAAYRGEEIEKEGKICLTSLPTRLRYLHLPPSKRPARHIPGCSKEPTEHLTYCRT